jgi:uncharacterized protein YjbJ (UPF0337 family)
MSHTPTTNHFNFLQGGKKPARSIGPSDRRVGRSPAILEGEAMSINKDQVEGRVKEAAGKVQEVAGKAVGSTTQQVKGTANKVAGAAQAKYGDVKNDLKNDLKDSSSKQDR